MGSNEPQGGAMYLGAQPHTWDEAATLTGLSRLEDPLRTWLHDSGLPGTDKIAEDGAWPTAERVPFLKLICGESNERKAMSLLP